MIFTKDSRCLNLRYVNFLFKQLFLAVCLLLLSLFSCETKKSRVTDESVQNNIELEAQEDETVIEDKNKSENDPITRDLLKIMNGDPYLWILVDKKNPIGDYEPTDLVVLKSANYDNTAGIQLREIAAASLEEMAVAARKDGVKLVVSSAYRSRSYQANLYDRYVKTMGQEATDRVSARPGYSQHQLGLIVDFYPVDNVFAKSAEGVWVKANASKYGWSLSYPDGLESLTGYSWESWHYRYVGKELAEFIDKYFDGIQQNALVYIHEWEQKRAF
ncbi:D-alanyl-D-alanine carboxypeptidase [Treponema sp. R8-4-B8]